MTSAISLGTKYLLLGIHNDTLGSELFRYDGESITLVQDINRTIQSFPCLLRVSLFLTPHCTAGIGSGLFDTYPLLRSGVCGNLAYFLCNTTNNLCATDGFTIWFITSLSDYTGTTVKEYICFHPIFPAPEVLVRLESPSRAVRKNKPRTDELTG